MRARHAEKIRAKRLQRDLEKAVRTLRVVTDTGDEAVVFTPEGQVVHLRRESETTFRGREVEGEDAAVRIVERWHDEAEAAEAVV